MRLWMVNPRIMCRKHLLGEHQECHAFIGTLNKETSITNYLRNNLFEPLSLVRRHNAIVNEFIRRGQVGHNTPISEFDVNFRHLKQEEIGHVIDRKSSLQDLLNRCVRCFENAKKYKNKIDLLDAFYTLYSCPHCNNYIEFLTNDYVYSNYEESTQCDHCNKIIMITPKIDYCIKTSKNEGD